jgi:peroxiredoxin
VQLQRAHDELEGAGEVVLIGQATPRHAAHIRRRLELEFPLLADEKRESYRAAGAKIATATELIGPKMLAKGVQESRRSGVVQGRTIGHPAQLGGTLVVETDGKVVWSRMSEDASDNATPEEIIAALERASGAN